jgi:hypothetical protein
MAKILLVQGMFCARIELIDDSDERSFKKDNAVKDASCLDGSMSFAPDRTITSHVRTATSKKNT